MELMPLHKNTFPQRIITTFIRGIRESTEERKRLWGRLNLTRANGTIELNAGGNVATHEKAEHM
jgi:hypothetical protein